MEIASPTTKLYCNVIAMQKGLDPVGHAHHFDDALVIETPLPWKNDMYEKAGVLPQEVIDLFEIWIQRYRDGFGYPHRSLMVAPDKVYSQPDMARVMFYTRPTGAFARYSKIEYLVPRDKLGQLVWALYEARDELPQFEVYRQPADDSKRELLVCTHGNVDVACAKFGYPLYKYLRAHHASNDVRVWRVSHFGGHMFAPTMMDMPTGHYWAYVEKPQAEQIVRQNGDVRALYGHYRGWAGLEDGFLQAAERELWMQYGWEWFNTPKSGQLTSSDETDKEEPAWAEIQIDYTAPDNIGKYTAHVEARHRIPTIHSTDSESEYAYPQYTVTPR